MQTGRMPPCCRCPNPPSPQRESRRYRAVPYAYPTSAQDLKTKWPFTPFKPAYSIKAEMNESPAPGILPGTKNERMHFHRCFEKTLGAFSAFSMEAHFLGTQAFRDVCINECRGALGDFGRRRFYVVFVAEKSPSMENPAMLIDPEPLMTLPGARPVAVGVTLTLPLSVMVTPLSS